MCKHDWVHANTPGLRRCYFCGTEDEWPGHAPRKTGRDERAKVVAFLRGVHDELARQIENGDHTKY